MVRPAPVWGPWRKRGRVPTRSRLEEGSGEENFHALKFGNLGEGAYICVHCVDGLEDEVAVGRDGVLECMFYFIVICAAVVLDE